MVSPLEIKVFTESLNLEQPLVLKEENKETTNIFSKDELVEDDFVYDYEDEINEEEELEEDTNEEYLTVSKKIEAELQEITPLYKSLMLDEDDDDIDIDYVDSEPDLHIVDLDYGEEEALDYLEYDEYADSEIEDILNEVDEEIEETLSPKPKIIDFKSRQTTIEANKIVSLVNIGMGNLFDIVSPIYKEVDIKEDTDESLEDEDEDLEDLEELEDEELEEE